MELQVKRFSSQKNDTLGLWFIENRFECFSLEDEKRDIKIKGETRIPEGRYEIELYPFGNMHQDYQKKFGREFHKGMLHIKDVPGFSGILIHILNKETQTMGCIGVGDLLMSNKNKKGFLGESTNAYKRLYAKVRDALLKKEKVYITITDIEEHD